MNQTVATTLRNARAYQAEQLDIEKEHLARLTRDLDRAGTWVAELTQALDELDDALMDKAQIAAGG